MTEQDLIEQREQIQQDLVCILDGMNGVDNDTLDNVCQVIVDCFQVLINKLDEKQ